MCLARHDSLSSRSSEPKLFGGVSLGTQRITLPSSPAEARVSPASQTRVSGSRIVQSREEEEVEEVKEEEDRGRRSLA